MRYLGAGCDDYTALASAQLRVDRATSLLAFVYLNLVRGSHLLAILTHTCLTNIKMIGYERVLDFCGFTNENGDCDTTFQMENNRNRLFFIPLSFHILK